MPSLSFDPVAHAYDATRGYPAEVAAQIAQAVAREAEATAETRFLEVGIGTGRIAFPLAAAGHDYTGVDIAQKMLEQLELKLQAHGWQEHMQPWGTLPDEDASRPALVRRYEQEEPHASLRLALADMTALPFYKASFDVVVAVHVFHLVDGWEQAVEEALRVLRPGGLFLHCWDAHVDTGRDTLPIEAKWQEIVSELGATINRPGSANTRSAAIEHLRQRGLQPQEVRPVRWQRKVTPRQALETVTKRLWSSTWVVPDDIFKTSAERLERWADDYFGGTMDSPRTVERQFVISKTRVV